MKNVEPVVCTLTPEQRRLQGKGWKDALVQFARRARVLPDGFEVTLANDRAAISQIAELVAREQACCRWMNITLRSEGDKAVLTITADSREGVTALAGMLAFSETLAARRDRERD